MSIKKEIDRAVKRTAALNGKTMPKTPAEQWGGDLGKH